MLYCCDIVYVYTISNQKEEIGIQNNVLHLSLKSVSRVHSYTAKEDYNVYPQATLGGIRCARCTTTIKPSYSSRLGIMHFPVGGWVKTAVWTIQLICKDFFSRSWDCHGCAIEKKTYSSWNCIISSRLLDPQKWGTRCQLMNYLKSLWKK